MRAWLHGREEGQSRLREEPVQRHGRESQENSSSLRDETNGSCGTASVEEESLEEPESKRLVIRIEKFRKITLDYGELTRFFSMKNETESRKPKISKS